MSDEQAPAARGWQGLQSVKVLARSLHVAVEEHPWPALKWSHHSQARPVVCHRIKPWPSLEACKLSAVNSWCVADEAKKQHARNCRRQKQHDWVWPAAFNWVSKQHNEPSDHALGQELSLGQHREKEESGALSLAPKQARLQKTQSAPSVFL